MNRTIAVWVFTAVLVGGAVVSAQMTKGGAGTSTPPDKARLQQVMDAWASLDASKAAQFYAKDPGLAFYDIAPRKYSGWNEYAMGAAEMFKTVKSLTLKLGDDAQVHQTGNVAWTTATVDGEMVSNDGSKMPVNARWTSIWEKRKDTWVIVHDHFSMPLPEPQKSGTR